MVRHYDPYPDDDFQTPFCGTPETENTETTTRWSDVTCNKCLKMKEKAERFVAETEAHILDEMKSFNEFFESQKQALKNKE